MPRPKHQTQALYTAPRLSDRFDRSSPLNSRRTANDNYHDNNKTSSSQSARPINKNHRRHSTNTYTSSVSSNAGHKELSPSGSLNAGTVGTNFYENSKNLKDGGGSGSGGNNSSSSSTNQKYVSKKVVKRKKTASHFDNATSNTIGSNAGATTAMHNAIATVASGSKNGTNSNTNANYLGKAIKMAGTSSR